MLGKLVQEQKLLALERNGACWISGAIDEEKGWFYRSDVWSDTWRRSSFGSLLKEEIFAWVKGIGSKFRILYLRNWSLEKKAGKEPVREKEFGVKDLPGAGILLGRVREGEVVGQE